MPFHCTNNLYFKLHINIVHFFMDSSNEALKNVKALFERLNFHIVTTSYQWKLQTKPLGTQNHLTLLNKGLDYIILRDRVFDPHYNLTHNILDSDTVRIHFDGNFSNGISRISYYVRNGFQFFLFKHTLSVRTT